MTISAEKIMWSPLQEFAPAGTTTAEVEAATVPWVYGDFETEYRVLRGTAGKIDYSSAGLIEATGDSAYDLLQYALARDLEFVTPEQSLISLLVDEAGRPIDIVNAYHSEDGYRLETAVGRGPGTLAHLEKLAVQLGLEVDLALRTDLTVILVEGPQAGALLSTAIEPDLASLPLSGLIEVEYAGTEVLVSRTGFTGEYGYKLIVPAESAAAVWNALDTVEPVGHRALELAMFEVRQPLLHRESVEGVGAIENGYAWLIDITKEEFHGRDAVVGAFESGIRVTAIGFVAGDTIEPPAPGEPVIIDGESVGSVLHAVFTPGTGGVIGLARMRADLVAPTLGITVGGVEAATAAAPYVIPVSWTVR